MNQPGCPATRQHLWAAVIALAVVGGCGNEWLQRVKTLERRYLQALAPQSARVKDLGIAWQKETFAEPSVLPLYGSSELIKKAPNKASQFFAHYRSGFAVSPVGRPSCTTLILLEKLAASAVEARGRKVVISLSPSWFWVKGATHDGFGGNFSVMQASELFFNAPLSLQLKADIARRMLRYPEVFNKSPALAAAVHGLAGPRQADRVLYYACLPLGRLQSWVYRLQDHFELVAHLKQQKRLRHVPKRTPAPPDWEVLMVASQAQVRPLPEDVADFRLRQFANDAAFLQALQRSYEWGDLEVLLRTIQELGLKPLLLSMPIEYAHFERMGISPECIDAYAWTLHDFARRYHMPVVDFADLGEDPQFFADHYGHPSAKGWLYLDRALDDFYHDRPAYPGTSLPEGDTAWPTGLSSPPTGRPRLPRSGPSSAIPGT